jgi:hypothetical protein
VPSRVGRRQIQRDYAIRLSSRDAPLAGKPASKAAGPVGLGPPWRRRPGFAAATGQGRIRNSIYLFWRVICPGERGGVRIAFATRFVQGAHSLEDRAGGVTVARGSASLRILTGIFRASASVRSRPVAKKEELW